MNRYRITLRNSLSFTLESDKDLHARRRHRGDRSNPRRRTMKITSTVDSENGFGAMLRSSFTCTVTDQGGRWHLDSLSVNQ